MLTKRSGRYSILLRMRLKGRFHDKKIINHALQSCRESFVDKRLYGITLSLMSVDVSCTELSSVTVRFFRIKVALYLKRWNMSEEEKYLNGEKSMTVLEVIKRLNFKNKRCWLRVNFSKIIGLFVLFCFFFFFFFFFNQPVT